MSFGERLKSAREKAGLTQAALGEIVGVSGVAIMRYEKNVRQPRIDLLQKIAEVLGITMDSLLGLSKEEKETIEYVEAYVSDCTDRKKEEVRRAMLEEKILDIPHEAYNSALEVADAAVLAEFKTVPDSQLKQYVLEDYALLNRRGRIEAAIRMSEISENFRFKKVDDKD